MVAAPGMPGSVTGANRIVAFQRRRAPALAVPGIADQRGQTGGHHVDGDAGDDLVAALGDDGEAVHQREDDRRRDAGRKPDPGVPGNGATPRPRRRRRPASCPPARCRRRPSAPTTAPQGRRTAAGRRGARRSRRSRCVDAQHVHRLSRPSGRARAASPSGRRNMSVERAREQDHQPRDRDDHVAGDRRHVERELRAALVEDAEQDRGQHDADRMRAPHQRDRDADEAEPADKLEQQPMLDAHDLVDRDPPASPPEISMR